MSLNIRSASEVLNQAKVHQDTYKEIFRNACEKYYMIMVAEIQSATEVMFDRHRTEYHLKQLADLISTESYIEQGVRIPFHLVHYGPFEYGNGGWTNRRAFPDGIQSPFRRLQKELFEKHQYYLRDVSDNNKSKKIIIIFSATPPPPEDEKLDLWHKLDKI